MEASLTGEQGKLKGKVFKLKPGRVYLIGRISVADIRVPDNMVSRNHCKLEFRDDKWFVVDLNSSNGTFVNEERVDSAELKPGDVLKMGQTVFRFELAVEKPPEEAPEPEPQAVAPPADRPDAETVEDEEGEELFSLLERAEKIEEESQDSEEGKEGGLFELLKEDEKEEKKQEEEGQQGGILSFLKKKKKEDSEG